MVDIDGVPRVGDGDVFTYVFLRGEDSNVHLGKSVTILKRERGSCNLFGIRTVTSKCVEIDDVGDGLLHVAYGAP